MVRLIHEKYATYYHANKMSASYLFCLLLYFLMITVPFLIGFTSNGTHMHKCNPNLDFWLRTSLYWETPTILSTNQYIIAIQTTDQSYTYTNIPDILRERPNSELLPIIQFQSNSDDTATSENSRPNNFTVLVELPQNAKNIRFIQVILFFTYELSMNVKLKMQTFVEVSLSSSVGMNKALVVGQLRFNQRHPIMAGYIYSQFQQNNSGVTRQRYNYPPYFDEDGALLQDPIQIIEANLNRNGLKNIFCYSFQNQSRSTIDLSCSRHQRRTVANQNQSFKFPRTKKLCRIVIQFLFFYKDICHLSQRH